tara:strand:- start:1215 stop:1343 length:129 start_codon:yes stop_codon:yes gene_type:complete
VSPSLRSQTHDGEQGRPLTGVHDPVRAARRSRPRTRPEADHV